MIPGLEEWLLEQGPLVALGAIGIAALWLEHKASQRHMQQMLDECWKRILEMIDQ